jgi:hypothetical protein
MAEELSKPVESESVANTATKPIDTNEIAAQILILAHSKVKPMQIKEAIFAHYENIKNSEYDQAIEIAQTEMDKLSSTENNSLVKAFLFSFGAAVLTAILWAVITVVTNFEIGYMAILIGFGVAYPVQKWMGKRGLPYQVIAVLAALFGVFLGKYLTIVFGILKLADYDFSYLKIATYPGLIFDIISKDISPYDFLWIIFACGYAFITLNKPKLKIDA